MMRNFIGFVAVLFVFWLATCVLTFILQLLFSNIVTGTITFLGVFAGFGWLLYIVGASILNDKKEN